MKLVICCDCGESETFDQRDYQRDEQHIQRAVEEWQREHIRQHEKAGDHDEHAFTSAVEQ